MQTIITLTSVIVLNLYRSEAKAQSAFFTKKVTSMIDLKDSTTKKERKKVI